jgi:hypothetical protein
LCRRLIARVSALARARRRRRCVGVCEGGGGGGGYHESHPTLTYTRARLCARCCEGTTRLSTTTRPSLLAPPFSPRQSSPTRTRQGSVTVTLTGRYQTHSPHGCSLHSMHAARLAVVLVLTLGQLSRRHYSLRFFYLLSSTCVCGAVWIGQLSCVAAAAAAHVWSSVGALKCFTRSLT